MVIIIWSYHRRVPTVLKSENPTLLQNSVPAQTSTRIALPLPLPSCTCSGGINEGFLSIELVGRSYMGIVSNVEDTVFWVLLK